MALANTALLRKARPRLVGYKLKRLTMFSNMRNMQHKEVFCKHALIPEKWVAQNLTGTPRMHLTLTGRLCESF